MGLKQTENQALTEWLGNLKKPADAASVLLDIAELICNSYRGFQRNQEFVDNFPWSKVDISREDLMRVVLDRHELLSAEYVQQVCKNEKSLEGNV